MTDRVRDEASTFCAGQYHRLVGGLALYLGDRAVAEELAQEALLRAFGRWEHVRKLESPEGWVWRVAINLANSTFRRRSAERRAHQRLTSRPEHDQYEEDPTARIAVRRAVSHLPKRQRVVLVLRFYLDLSVEATATRMNASPDAVRSLTKRAVAALRDELHDDAIARIEEGR